MMTFSTISEFAAIPRPVQVPAIFSDIGGIRCMQRASDPVGQVGALVDALVPSQWPKVVQKVEIQVGMNPFCVHASAMCFCCGHLWILTLTQISFDGALATCTLVLAFGAAFSGVLWSSAFLLRVIHDVRRDQK